MARRRRLSGPVEAGLAGQVAVAWVMSQTIRCMMKTKLAKPILVLARAMPMVRKNRHIGLCCRAKTRSIAERTGDLRALARTQAERRDHDGR